MKLGLYLIVGLSVTVVAGCATERMMITGRERSPIPPGNVRMYRGMPEGAESVAIVMVESGGKGQGSLDRATKMAKEKAASVGANGLVPHMGGTETVFIDYFPINRTHFTFDAIYVESH